MPPVSKDNKDNNFLKESKLSNNLTIRRKSDDNPVISNDVQN